MIEYLGRLWEWTPLLLKGIEVTLLISAASMAFSIVLGLLVALARISNPGRWYWPVHWLLRAYVETLRGLPLVVTLFIIFFALPSVGFKISDDPIIIGIFGMTLSLAAYLSEVFRAAILSVDPGQMEAALSLGMSKTKAYQRIVLPQALIVAVPTLGGYFISLLKDSSLLGFISVVELFRTGLQLVSVTFRAFEIYFTIGAIYLALSLLAAWAVSTLEARLRPLEVAYLGHARPVDIGSVARGAMRAEPDVQPESLPMKK